MSSAPMDYSEKVLGHFRSPQNSGSFPAGTVGVAHGAAGDRKRGREIRLELRLAKDGRIEASRYRVYGCPATIALCSVMSERLVGMTASEAAELSGLALAEELELPAVKRDAALLLEDALRSALAEYNVTNRLRA